MASIDEIEGVGPAYAEKLTAASVKTVEALLESGATVAGRKGLAEQTGISDHLILTWVNHADLFRIKGVAGEYAELLEAAGVDTVPELAERNAANLHAKLTEINESKHLVRRVGSEADVEKWIAEAKTLERAVHF